MPVHGTFSKTLSPDMRMSYVVLTERLAATFRAVFDGFQGMELWLKQAALVERAAAHGVRVYPASPFWADARRYPGNCLFIGYGMLSEADIAAALERLRQAWFPATAVRG